MQLTVKLAKARLVEERVVSYSSDTEKSITIYKQGQNLFISMFVLLISVIKLYLFALPTSIISLKLINSYLRMALKRFDRITAKQNLVDLQRGLKAVQDLYNGTAETLEIMFKLPVVPGSNSFLNEVKKLTKLLPQIIVLYQNKIPVESVYSKEELEELKNYWDNFKQTNPETYNILLGDKDSGTSKHQTFAHR